MYLKKYFLILFILISNLTFAQKVSQTEIIQVADNFISASRHKELLKEIPKIEPVSSVKTNKVLFYIINFKSAYLIISADKNNTPVKAFSFKRKFICEKNSQNFNMKDILISDYENYNLFISENPTLAIQNHNKWNENLNNKTSSIISTDSIGPLLPSLFGQTWYYESGNKIYTTQYYTPNHNPVGCVALTFTELMQYYNWPRKGTGNHSYSDSYGSTTGNFSANFEEKYYNWGLILNEYKGTTTTEAQRKEIGRLAFHAAVSVNMDFESSGSTSNVNRIPNAAKNYFRYIADYKEKSASDFWNTLDQNLQDKIPAQFAIYTSGGAGHAVVCDGYYSIGNDKYYHLNMGWWGTTNGWYQIRQSFNAGGYSNITAAVLNMIPVPEFDKKYKIDYENKTAELKWYYPERNPAQNFELQIKRGVSEWETYTDTLTKLSYIFKPEDDKSDYSFRIRAKVHDTWYNDSWSNSIKIKHSSFKPKGSAELTLKPNVTSNKFIISYNNLSGSTIKIYNLYGELVFENTEEVLINECQIDVSALQTGIYIVQVNKNGDKQTAKFLKL